MGTRAAYTIAETYYGGTDIYRNFYCHWDGYPLGAASRFFNMIREYTQADNDPNLHNHLRDSRGGFTHAFIRGNLDAEPIISTNDIAGVQYHYIVDATDKNEEPTIQIGGEIKGTLREWLNQCAKDDGAFDDYKSERVCAHFSDGHYGKKGITLALESEAIKIRDRCIAISKRFDDTNPNRKGYEQRAETWSNVIF